MRLHLWPFTPPLTSKRPSARHSNPDPDICLPFTLHPIRGSNPKNDVRVLKDYLIWTPALRTTPPLPMDRFVLCLSVAVFVAHPIVCLTLFGTLSCKKIDGAYRIFADTTLTCFEGEWAVWFISMGVPGLIFCFGVPVYTYVILNRFSDEIKAGGLSSMRTYAFVFADFKDDFLYWESVPQGPASLTRLQR